MKWLATGVIVLLIGFGYDIFFVNLPYQDPTPAMQGQWEASQTVASALYWIGLAILLSGLLRISLFRKKSMKEN